MRLWPWRRRAVTAPAPLVDDGTLEVLGGSFDPARSDAEVLAELGARGVDLDRDLLVRHHLTLPDEPAVRAADPLVVQEGYRLSASATGGGWAVRATRAERVSGLSLARERSRMAGLAQRLGGDAAGWDLCGPPREPVRDPAGG